MSLWAVIPFRSLRSGKQRLSGILDDEARRNLNDKLLRHVIAETKATEAIDHTLVISPDAAALELAGRCGVEGLPEAVPGDPNCAIEQAIAHASRAAAVLIVAADLPFLRSQSIAELLTLRAAPPQLIIAPDRHGDGTNLLYLEPPDLVRPQFGIDSHALHICAARRRHARVSHYHSEDTAVDIDTPGDWDSYARRLAPLLRGPAG